MRGAHSEHTHRRTGGRRPRTPHIQHRAQSMHAGEQEPRGPGHRFSKALWVGWQEIDDPPSGEVDAGLLGGILRDKFGAGLSSITEEQLNHTSKFTIVGI